MLWPDGRHIASNGLGRIFLWEIETGECTPILKTEAGGSLRVWSLDSTECLAVHELGHANLGGLMVHKDSIDVTCRRELVVIPLPPRP